MTGTVPRPPGEGLRACAHEWINRGSMGDDWRECFLCGAQEDRPAHPEPTPAAGLVEVIARTLHEGVPGVECSHIPDRQPTCERDAAHVAAEVSAWVRGQEAEAWERGVAAARAYDTQMRAYMHWSVISASPPEQPANPYAADAIAALLGSDR